MKKIKKMLAGLLGAAMVLTSFGTPTLADTTTPLKTTPATIDTTQKGSITIHKYEFNGTDDKKGTATGKDKDTVPEGATALEGAEFTIYKVENVDKFDEFYTYNKTEVLPSVDNYINNDKTIKTDYNKENSKKTVTTNNNGIAEFKNLDLGLYVVIETKTPAKVTTPEDPFLVSVPMTTTDGTEWLYDVHVYPKNKTTYGSVTLEKSGNNNEKLQNVSFALQRATERKTLSGATVWESIKTNDKGVDISTSLKTNANGQITVDDLAPGSYRFIETSLNVTATDNKNGGYIMDGATAYEFSITNEGKVSYKDKTESNITIPVKNEKPDLTKEVKDRTASVDATDADTWKHDADYNIGDTIPYRIKIDVPSNITKLKTFTVTDTPTHLEDNVGSIEMVYNKSADEPNATIEAGSGELAIYRAEADSSTKGFKITFNPKNMAAYAKKTITITYTATLLPNAAVTSKDGNPNKATLEYSNQILPDSKDDGNPNQPGEPKNDKIEDHASVYTFDFKIHKTNSNNENLDGVKFDLYKQKTLESEMAVTDDEAKAAGLDTSENKKWVKIDTLETDKDGVAQGSTATGIAEKKGLANGTYYLVETETKPGYNLLKKPVEVVLNLVYSTSFQQESKTTADGVTTITKNEIVTKNNSLTKGNDITVEFDSESGAVTQNIINRKGFTLPKTGDIGTAMFLIIGIGGMLAAVYIMLRGRKRA